ncbi:MAG: DNA-processing protein DprA [Thermomicrobiales bacterium]|nr:DNA-processing protein DprA [Thermomicrobiales bacterium]
MPVTTEPDRIVLPGDDDLPDDIRAYWPEAVPALYVRGPFPTAQPAIAIIGTTAPSPIARSWAFACGREAVRSGWAVVSGMARGIDGAAHEGALAAGGVTIGVVANGLDSHYPPGRESLTQRVLERGGTIVSISPPGIEATHEGLLLRNQFTCAMSDIVLAVQSRGRGGTLAATRHAARQGKLIAAFAPPADGEREEWSGNELLLGEASPWRDRAITWRPACRLTDPAQLPELFAHFARQPSVDAPDRLFETRKPEQPRLLEERATYNGDE